MNRGNPGLHKNGTPRVAKTVTEHGREPDSQAMIEAFDKAGGGQAGEKAANAIFEEAKYHLAEATIVLGPGADKKSKLHELGHVEQALKYPREFISQAQEAANASTDEEYQESDSEKYARLFATYALKDGPDDPTD